MPVHRLVVIGASAGGVEALVELTRGLPPNLPAPVCVVIHQPDRAQTLLPQILQRAGRLPVALATDGAPLRSGTIHVAPPGAHLIVQAGRLRLMRTARENGHRPAIDPLFRSAARACGRDAIGVLLSGADDDGTEGLMMIKARGGVAFVQDPREALFSRMPESAIAHVGVDEILPAAALAQAIERAVEPPKGGAEAVPMQPELNPEEDREQLGQKIAEWKQGKPADCASGFSCPLCGGSIWVGNEGSLPRYRCETGHEFSQESFLSEQEMMLETTLWHAVRALNERV